MAPKTIQKISSRRRRDRFRNHPRENFSNEIDSPGTNEPVTDMHANPANESWTDQVSSGCLTTFLREGVEETWKISRDETIMKNMQPDAILSQTNGAIADVSEGFYNQDEERAEEIRSELNRSIPDSNRDMAQDNNTLDDNDPVSSVEGDAIEYECEQDAVFSVTLQQRSQTLTSWQAISCLLVACGTVRLTKSQFDTFRNFMNWSIRLNDPLGEILPSFSKLQNVLMRTVRKYAWAKSFVMSFTISFQRAGFSSSQGSVSIAPVRIVPASSWAHLDMMTSSIYECISHQISDSSRAEASICLFETIERSPIVQNRRKLVRADECIYAELSGSQDEQYSLPDILTHNSGLSITFQCTEELFDALLSQGILKGTYSWLQEVSGFLGPVNVVERYTSSVSGNLSRYLPGCNAVETRLIHILSSYLPNPLSIFDPGDIYVPVHVSADSSVNAEGLILLLVYHVQKKSFHVSRNELIAIPLQALKDDTLQENMCIVGKVSRVKSKSEISNSLHCRSTYAPHLGLLKDGRRYIVYRMLIYCDDFQPYTTRKGSAGGCYMLPLGVSPSKRSGYGAVRVLGLTPPGISTNVILSELIKDIVKGSTAGFESFDSDGLPITVFLDVVGFIGDYPAITHVNDLLGHTACSPCHLCTFQREDGSGTGASRYGYTSKIHARSSAFARTLKRMKAVRSNVTSPSSMRALGIKAAVEDSVKPLHLLSEALERIASHVPLTEYDIPVVPAVFDPYQSCFVAPDHLLSGMAIDVINACIVSVTVQVRRVAEILIKESLFNGNILTKQNKLFSISPPSLLSMTLSDVFGVLLVAPTCFKNALYIVAREDKNSKKAKGKLAQTNQVSQNAVSLLEQFQVLVARTYYLPSSLLDGENAVISFNMGDGRIRINELYVMACEYLTKLDSLCRISEDMRKHLDKPNAHRLVELYAHTLPAFGHVHHVQELVFESAHQPLKRGLRNSNHRDEQVFAVSAALASDWESRLAFEVEKAIASGKVWNSKQCIRIERLLLGDASLKTSLLKEGRTIQDVFKPPVLAELSRTRRRHCHYTDARDFWRLETPFGNDSEALEFTPFPEKASSALRLYRRISCGQNIRLFKSASRLRVDSFNASGKMTVRRRAKVSVGYILHLPEGISSSFIVDRANSPAVLDNSYSSSTGHHSLWKIIALLQNVGEGDEVFSDEEFQNTCQENHDSKEPLAVVMACVQINRNSIDGGCLVYVDEETHPLLLRLSSQVRETMQLHCCKNSLCSVNPERSIVEHIPPSHGCEHIYVYGRAQGYPPRIA
jgi:hypothetical protein